MIQSKFTLIKGIKLPKDLTNLLLEIKLIVEASTKLRFNTSKDPEEITWEPSKRVLDLRKKGFKAKTLIKSGDLQRKIQYTKDLNSVSIKIPSIVSYGTIHQKGIDGQKKRSFIGVSKSDKVKFKKAIQVYLK